MKKTFLIILLFLLPLQYTWAIVANYDMHDVHDLTAFNSKTHFGHHQHRAHQTPDNITDNIYASAKAQSNDDKQTAKVHDHFGFLHLSSGELLSQELTFFAPISKQLLSDYLLHYQSSPSYQPERPNWLAAV